MKTIKPDELFESLNDFLKGRGIELKDGAYAQRIRRACNLLGDAINATQDTAKKAKDGVDKKLEQVRQSIHEATAPKPPIVPKPKPEPSVTREATEQAPVAATSEDPAVEARPIAELFQPTAPGMEAPEPPTPTKKSLRAGKARKAPVKKAPTAAPSKKARKK